MSNCKKCKVKLGFFSAYDYVNQDYCKKCYEQILEKKSNERKKKISKFWNNFSFNPHTTPKKIINSWKPSRKFKKEKEYEKSLKSHIIDCLHDDVTNQYGVGRRVADIVIGKYVGIEIKNNLCHQGEYQRLLGQINLDKKTFKALYVVLVGKTNPEIFRELKKENKSYSTFSDNSITIIKK